MAQLYSPSFLPWLRGDGHGDTVYIDVTSEQPAWLDDLCWSRLGTLRLTYEGVALIYRQPQLLSDCETYEYAFRRTWDRTKPAALWVMLNPSMITPDPGERRTPKDGHTVARCEGFSRRLGCGSLVTANVFAHRATDPTRLKLFADPVGPDNDAILGFLLDQAEIVIAAWGASFPSSHATRVREVRDMLRAKNALCLGKTSDGHPLHPRALGKDTEFIPL